MISFFNGFDHNILSFWHSLAESTGGALTPLFKFITLIGEKGIWMLVLAVILMCFAKTRKIGICLFGAVCCGALVTNIVLKDLIARPRPFEVAGLDYRSWWIAIGQPFEDGYSFPSGHVTAAAAGVLAMAFTWDKKVLLAGVPYVMLMGAARNYLMAHYPTDVLGGCAVGLFSAVVAYGITVFIYWLLEKYEKTKLARLVLYDIDAAKLFRPLIAKIKERRAATEEETIDDEEDETEELLTVAPGEQPDEEDEQSPEGDAPENDEREDVREEEPEDDGEIEIRFFLDDDK